MAEPPENKVWYLKRSRLFERATDEQILNCEHLFVQQHFAKRSVLFQQGDQARVVYLIKSGRVRIARRSPDDKEITIAMLGPGDLFGEEVVFSQVERQTLAICMERSLLCMARAEDVYGLISRNPVLALNIAKYLSERLEDTQTLKEDVMYLKVTDRLLRLFGRLALEYGKPVPDGTLLDVRLTHADIASLIGSTRETVSAQIAHLTREGRLRSDGRAIVLVGTAVPG